MRFKVKVPESFDFDEAKRILISVPIFVESRKRRMFGTGDLPDDVRSTLEASGANVHEDSQYEADDTSA